MAGSNNCLEHTRGYAFLFLKDGENRINKGKFKGDVSEDKIISNDKEMQDQINRTKLYGYDDYKFFVTLDHV